MDNQPLAEHTPQYVSADKGPAIITVICVVTVLETLFTAARLYVRAGIMKKLQPDDYIIMFSVVRARLGLPFH